MSNDSDQLVETIKPMNANFSIGKPLSDSKLNPKNPTQSTDSDVSKGLAGSAKGGSGKDIIGDGGATAEEKQTFDNAMEHMDDGLKVHFSTLDDEGKRKLAKEVLAKANVGEEEGKDNTKGQEGDTSEDDDDQTGSDDSDSEDTDAKPKVVSSFRETIGFETDAEYPETFEGLNQLAVDYGNDIFEKNKESLISKTFKDNPTLSLHEKFIKAGYTANDFASFIASGGTSKVTVDDKTSEEQMANIVKGSLKGTSEQVADGVIAQMKENGTLKSNALEIANKINEGRKAFLSKVTQEYNQNQKELEDQRKATTVEMVNILKSGKLGDITLDKKELAEFAKFQTVRDSKGMTALDYKEAELTALDELRIRYSIFKDFKNVGTAPNGKDGKTKMGVNDFSGLNISDRMGGKGSSKSSNKKLSMRDLVGKLNGTTQGLKR